MEWTVDAGESGQRLDKFLAAPGRLASRGRANAALAHGKVLVNERDAEPADGARRLASGDVVRIWMDRPGSAKRRLGARRDGDLHIVFEDEALVVVDKPAGLLAVPLDDRADAPSVLTLLEDHLRSHRVQKPRIVHRIDRDTSGLVLFAKSPLGQARLKAQFKRREPTRVYRLVVHGHPTPAEGTWRDRLAWDDGTLTQRVTHARDARGVEAVCDYRVIESFADASLVEVRLHTGKRNQIRVQAGARGHVLVGEQRYVFDLAENRRIDFPRQALHAYRLAFRHPDDGRMLEFESPLPPDMARLLSRLRAPAPRRAR